MTTSNPATFTSNGASKAPPISRMVRAKDLVLDHEFWHNPRSITGLGDKEIEGLADDIKVRGVQIPLLVIMVKSAGGGFITLVLEGQRRTLAAMHLDPNMILPVIDKSTEPVDLTWDLSDRLLLDMLAVGGQREGLSDYELSEVAERMRNRGKSLADINLAIRRSESWISRVLTARASATPKLLIQWRKGQVTTEAFKELAAVKAPEEQIKKVDAVIEAAKAGNKGEARALAKEAGAAAKAAAKPTPVKPKVEPVVKGPQADLWNEKALKEAGADTDAPKPVKPAKKPMTSRLMLEELVAMADKRPPTAELVRGIVMGVKYALGEMDPSEFGKGWNAYVNRIHGVVAHKPKKSAAPKKAVKSKPAKKATKKPAKSAKKSK